VTVSGDRPGEGRYAHLEREQRWIAAGVPPEARRAASIIDRYIRGTRLRLRRSEADEGVAYKLGQKIRANRSDPEVVKLTNLYLSAEEYAVLAALPAAELSKTRWHAPLERKDGDDRPVPGRLEGLVLAELELDGAAVLLPPPNFALRDVTNEDPFSGGALAFASDAAIDELLLGVRATTGR